MLGLLSETDKFLQCYPKLGLKVVLENNPERG